MALGQYLSVPAAAAGISVTTNATAWVLGEATLSTGLTSDIYVIGLAFQVTNTPALDTTHETLFQIRTGGVGSEVVQIQIPYSHRPDTLVGYYSDSTLKVFLPEDFLIPANTRISVTAACSLASAITYAGIKLMYREGAAAANARSQLMMLGVS